MSTPYFLCGNYLKYASSVEDGTKCQLWVTGKAIPNGKRLLKIIPKDALVVNFSVPNPIPESLFHKRPDLTFVEGGLLAYDYKKTDLSFTMRLRPGITYACHAGTMVHAFMGWKHHEVGHVDLSHLPTVWKAAMDLGFFLPVNNEEPDKIDLVIGVNQRTRI